MSATMLGTVRGTRLVVTSDLPFSLFALARNFSTATPTDTSTTSPSSTASPSVTPPSSTTQEESQASPSPSSSPPRLVVFGGSGYVGTRVCEAAVNLGADVVSISRHGRPPSLRAGWADAVKWLHGDAFDQNQEWREEFQGAAGVVSTLGAFGSNAMMYRVCGTANMTLMDAAAEVKVPRFSFISVHDYSFPGGWQADRFLLRGYFQGKRDAETHLMKLFPETGVALRPGFIYGTRTLPGGSSIPLGLVGAPLAAAVKLLPKSLANVPIVGAAFVPPVPVETVGRAAAASVLQPDRVAPGVMDVWTIAKF